MAVGRVDVLAQPEAGVGDLQTGFAEPAGDPLGRHAGGGRALLEAQLLSGELGALQQRLGQVMVVVARDEHDLAAGQRRAHLLEEGARALQRLGLGEVPELDRVAEQDQPVGGGDLLQQHLTDSGIAEQVLAGSGTEVEV